MAAQSLVLFLVACGVPQPGTQPVVVTPEIVEKTPNSLSDLGFYTSAVPLETRDECLLGRIDAVKRHSASGDFLVVDKSATKAVYRFDAEGRFLNGFGRLGRGPGEYETLFDAAFMDTGEVVLATDGKLILYDAVGDFIRERRVGFVGYWLEARGPHFYVYATSGMEVVDRCIWVFDRNLQKSTEIHPYDRRFDRVAFLPYRAVTLGAGGLFISELYDFQITVYDDDDRPTTVCRFPNFNGELDAFWQDSRKPEGKKLLTLFQGLHRPITLFAFGDLVYLLEIHTKRGIRRSNILDTRTWRLYRYEGLQLVGEPNQDDLSMDHVVGSFEGGLIGVCDNPAQFEKHKGRHEALREFSLRETDNPILVFFAIPHPDPQRPLDRGKGGAGHESR